MALEGVYAAKVYEGQSWTTREIPLRRAMNASLLDAYAEDCKRVLRRWNAVLEEFGLSERLKLPSTRFGRKFGIYADQHYDIDGNPIEGETLQARMKDWMPSEEDYALVQRSMVPVYEPGKMAAWIAPPSAGVGGKAPEFEYVLFH